MHGNGAVVAAAPKGGKRSGVWWHRSGSSRSPQSANRRARGHAARTGTRKIAGFIQFEGTEQTTEASFALKNIGERAVHHQLIFVLDQAELPELIHEKIHA